MPCPLQPEITRALSFTYSGSPDNTATGIATMLRAYA